MITTLEQIADQSSALFDRIMRVKRIADERKVLRDHIVQVKKLVGVVDGCPDGVTEDTLLANGFTQNQINHVAALCLVRVQRQTVSGFTVIRYWSAR